MFSSPKVNSRITKLLPLRSRLPSGHPRRSWSVKTRQGREEGSSQEVRRSNTTPPHTMAPRGSSSASNPRWPQNKGFPRACAPEQQRWQPEATPETSHKDDRRPSEDTRFPSAAPRGPAFLSPHLRGNSRGRGRGRDNMRITVRGLGDVLGWEAAPQEVANSGRSPQPPPTVLSQPPQSHSAPACPSLP